jgi:hypothetical protein
MNYTEMVHKIQVDNNDHRDKIANMVTEYAETVVANAMHLKTASEVLQLRADTLESIQKNYKSD